MEHFFKLTTHGRNILVACMAGEAPLNITRVSFGSGRVDEGTNLADMHELLHYIADGTVGERHHENDRLYLSVQYTNGAEHAGIGRFMLSEYIVYAVNPDTGQEQDFIYGTLGDYSQPVPACNPNFPSGIWDFPMTLVVSDEIDVVVSAPAGLVTYNDLYEMLNIIGTFCLDITIPTTGWIPSTEGGAQCNFAVDIPHDKITEKQIPDLTFLPSSLSAAAACGLCQTAQTIPGALRVYAKTVPTVPLQGSLTLSGLASYMGSGTTVEGGSIFTLPPASATRLGGVKVGGGLNIAEDGTLSVDTAGSEEINELLTGVLAPDNK